MSSKEGEGDELELEETWSEARREAGLDPDDIGVVRSNDVEPAELSPYTALYAGFFLGPAAALGCVLVAAGRRSTFRRIAVLIGICGATWCGVQGASSSLADGWSRIGVQVLRSGINFVGSTAMVVFLYREIPASFLHDRRTVATSVGVGTLFVLGFVAAPDSWLMILGR